MTERRTNIDVDQLARSPLVRRFMVRTAFEHVAATGDAVLIVDLVAKAAAAFDLLCEDGVTAARALLDVAAQVVAVELLGSLRPAKRRRECGGSPPTSGA